MESQNERRLINPIAAQIAIIGIITYQVLMAALIFIRPDLDPYWHTISEWAIGPYGWIMSLAFEVAAVSYAFLFIALRKQVSGVAGGIAKGLLLICVLGLVGVGAFTTDPLSTPPNQISTTGMIHMISGASQMLFLPFAALLISINLIHRNPAWSMAKTPLMLTGGLPLLGLIGFIAHFIIYLVPLGETAYGPDVPIGWPPRFLFLTYMVWVVTVAVQAIKVQKASVTSPPDPLS